jgi:5-methylcytosine-specific restriction endonuclease McrA
VKKTEIYRRRGSKYRRWRKRVLAKNGHKCALCGSTENLTIDHIEPLVRNPDRALDVENGRVLCDKCRVKDMLDSLMRGVLKRGDGFKAHKNQTHK